MVWMCWVNNTIRKENVWVRSYDEEEEMNKEERIEELRKIGLKNYEIEVFIEMEEEVRRNIIKR